jgi:flagellar hook protein FlgE
MGSISAIARSGLNAAQYSLGATAHNIANAQTANFRRLDVVQQSQDSGGVSASVRQLPSAQPAGDTLANDFVQQMVSSYAFKANVLSLQTEQKMMGSLLDMDA